MKTTLITICLAATALAGDIPIKEKKSLTHAGARRVIAAGVAEAKKNHSTGAFAVVDDGGNLIAVERVDGTFAAGPNIAIGKARTAALFQKETKFFEEVIGKGRTSMVTLNDFTPLQGGVPIVMDGQIVGAVGVSGAASAAQDSEFAVAASKALSDGMMSMNGKVTFFEAGKVSAAFDKG